MRHNLSPCFLRFVITFIALASLLMQGAPSSGQETRGQVAGLASSRPQQRRQAERRFKLTWTYHPQPQLAQNGYLRVPLPTQGAPYQSMRYEVTGARHHQISSENGNGFLMVVPNAQDPFTVTAYVTVRPFNNPAPARLRAAAADEAATAPVIPPDVPAYLQATEGVNPHSPTMQAIAEPLRDRTPVATINNVLRYLQNTVRYDLRQPSTDAQEVTERGAANCGGYTALFVALCRANGIPARQVWGLSWAYDRRTRHPRARGSRWFSDHEWAEVYLPGAGWVPVEPQARSFRPPNITCVRLAHYEPKAGIYLKKSAEAMRAHPPAVQELAQFPADFVE